MLKFTLILTALLASNAPHAAGYPARVMADVTEAEALAAEDINLKVTIDRVGYAMLCEPVDCGNARAYNQWIEQVSTRFHPMAYVLPDVGAPACAVRNQTQTCVYLMKRAPN